MVCVCVCVSHGMMHGRQQGYDDDVLGESASDSGYVGLPHLELLDLLHHLGRHA
jgi:hypothetical protein